MNSGSGTRTAFAERLALLYKEAGDPPLKRVAEAVDRLRRVDERGRPVRVSAQRISDWRRAKNVPAQFTALAAVLHVLIPAARRARPVPVSKGLYDLAQWQRLWEQALADPAGDRAEAPAGAADGRAAEAGEAAGVCPYRGLAAYRQQDARWFFGRERSRDDLVALVRAAERTGGVVALVGASGAGKSSLLNAGLIPAFRAAGAGDGNGPAGARRVLYLVPGSTPLTELTRRIPPLAEVVPARTEPAGAPDPGAATSDGARTGTAEPVPAAAAGAGAAAGAETGAAAEAGAETGASAEAGAGAGAATGLETPGIETPGIGTPAFTRAVHRAVTAWAADADGSELPASAARPLVIVDQFEETFALCPDEAERRTFIQTLHAMCSPAESGEPPPALVLVGVRADFYEQCLGHPELADALQHRHMVLGPLTTAELREAVAGPAKAVGLEIEPGLVELIVREVSADGPHGVHHAGVLPLLSHALLATWQRRKAGRLTVAGYRAAGGIQQAVATTAEHAWADLDPAARTAARQLLLRLVRLSEDTPATRRRATRRGLAEGSTDPGRTEESLEALVRARLVTLDAESVEITHEALLHAWPRLRGWMDEDRGGHLLRQRLEEDGRAWEDSGRDPSLLYRGSRLEQAHTWVKSAGADFLTRGAAEFLAASVRLRRRTVLLSRGAVATLIVLAVVAAASAVTALRQRDDAVFAQVSAEADRFQYSDPSLSAQLDLVAHDLRPADESTRNRLVSIVNAPLATPLTGHTGAVYLTSFAPDGRLLATAAYDRTVRLWDVTDPSRPEALGEPLTGHTSWVSTAVFSPDGDTLASASDDGTIRLWDVTDPARPQPLGTPLTGHAGTVYLLVFRPDGHTLASVGDDRTVRLWDVADAGRARPLATLTGHTDAVRSVAFSPDGRTLAAGGDDETILLWDTADPRRPHRAGEPLTGHTGTVHSVAFSPDGHTLASGGADDTIRLWNVTDPRRPTALGTPLTGHTGPVWSVAFNPAGTMLAAGSADSTATLWSVRDPAYPSQVGEPLAGGSGEMYAVGFSPDGRTLATGSGDSTVRLWSIPTSDMAGRVGAFRPDGRVLATAGRDGRVRLWNVTDPDRPRPLGEPFRPGEGDVRSLAFSPDGRTLAVLTGSHAVQLWNVADTAHPAAHAPPVQLRTRFAGPGALAYSPDGRTLATAQEDRTVQLWDARRPSRLRPLGAPLTGPNGYVNSLVFSPDGRALVGASADGTVRLWTVAAADTGSDSDSHRTGRVLGNHDGPVNTLAFSPDGRALASGSDDNTVRLWTLADPGAEQPVAALTGHTEAVVSLTFSPDSRTLASGGNDNTVRLWDVTTPSDAAPIGQSLSPNARTGNFLSFHPRNGMLGVSSGVDTVRLWNLDVDDAVRRICSATRNVLTPARWHEYLPRLSYDPPCDT